MVFSLSSSLYTVAFALCAFSTGVLSRREQVGRPARFFVGYLALESIGFALELLVVHPATPYKAVWLGLLMASSLLTAPMLWLAIREAVTGNSPRLASLRFGHFAAPIIGAVLVLPLIGSASAGTGWESGYGAHPPWHFRFIHEAMFASIAVFAVQAPWYLWRARKLLLAGSTARRQAGKPSPRPWHHLLLAVVGTTWILGLLRTAQCATHASLLWVVGAAFVDVGVTVVALYFILRDELATPALPTAGPASSTLARAAPVKAKYARSPLEPRHASRIREKLQTAFAEKTLHRDSLLNLRSLSREIGETTHAVSQVLNQELGMTFYELVNRARIEEAKTRLRDESERTVLEIALEVGYNSKSTFNSAFRRIAGCTPTEFRERNDSATAD